MTSESSKNSSSVRTVVSDLFTKAADIWQKKRQFDFVTVKCDIDDRSRGTRLYRGAYHG